MSKFDTYTGKALDLVTQVGGNLTKSIPATATNWIKTGAALGAAKTGMRVATKIARRNPVVAVAATVGAGALLYAVRRYQKKQQAANGTLEGRSTRIESKRAPRKRTTRTKASTPSRD